FAGTRRKQQQYRLSHRIPFFHHLDAAGRREAESGPILRHVEIGMKKTPCSVATNVHNPSRLIVMNLRISASSSKLMQSFLLNVVLNRITCSSVLNRLNRA